VRCFLVCPSIIFITTYFVAYAYIYPGYAQQSPTFQSNDIVPFRLTPNMQHFIGPIHMEGILTSTIFEIGRNLSSPEVCPIPLVSFRTLLTVL
jgi:hypothetical protein